MHLQPNTDCPDLLKLEWRLLANELALVPSFRVGRGTNSILDLKTCGVDDILIAVAAGLKGMAEVLATVYPAYGLCRGT